MGKIFEIFNFDNIGGKIKTLVKWSCWITILLTWVSAIIFFFILLFTEGAFFVAFLVPIAAILSSLLIWVGSWVAYAFGEHIEDTKAIRYNTATIDQSIRREKAEKAVYDKAENGNSRQPSSPLKPQKSADTAKAFPARSTDSPRKVHIEGEYVSGRTYYNGDEVIFKEKKYVCTAQNSTVWSPGSAPSQWQECSPSETEL